jgi:mitogen-activated protein kinase kinase
MVSSNNNISSEVQHPYPDPNSSASSSVSQLNDSALTGSATGSPRPKDDPEAEVKELEEHLSNLTISLNKELDVEDLDAQGWMAVSKLERIETMGGLGEGAGGAVTRCMLKGGKTIFALKVGFIQCSRIWVNS